MLADDDRASANCTTQAQNLASVPSLTNILVTGPQNGKLTIEDVSAPGVLLGPGRNGWSWTGTLSPALPPTVDALVSPGGSPFGYVAIGVAPVAGVGDETIVNFTVPAYRYGGEAYTRIGLTSNGYAVVGGGSAADVKFVPQTMPNAAVPNNVLAPYWTDLHMGRAGAGLRAAVANVAGVSWLVADWSNASVFTGGAQRSFQIWIRLGATEHIVYAYGSNMGPGDPEGLNVGAENRTGTSGKNLATVPPPSNSDLRVVTSPPTPGGTISFTYKAFGRDPGVFDIIAALTSNVMNGTASEKSTITVTP